MISIIFIIIILNFYCFQSNIVKTVVILIIVIKILFE